jgi:hypothetical protein
MVRFLATAVMVAAGTAVVGRAANLGVVSSDKLSAVSAALPTCNLGSITVGTTGSPITTVTVTLTSCTGAVANDNVYVTLHDTSRTTGNYLGYGTCTLLAGAHPNCPVTLTGKVRNSGTDSYSLEVLAEPAATGTPSSSANHLTLAAEYLTLRTCTTNKAGPPATC